ncbi:transporter [Herbaspirillum sp. LeCh32-8]|uniref:transporter n=1 Tax=Herbaspirillum sp. LeCh32-8 TaxID=2821356 RepID=UPI001FD7CCEB|nr:transporter [Herbaspirillum sp. LeCh32-8]
MNQAYAAHPLVTDDAGVQGEGRHQIEVNTDWSRQAGQSGHVGAFTYTYGVTDKLDLFANLPLTFQAKDGAGVGDYSLGAKWRYYDEEGLALAFKPEFFVPSGDAEKGLGNGKSGLGLTAIGSYETGPWTLHGNAGLRYNRYQLGSDDQSKRKLVWRASAATWYALSEQWRLVADTGLAQNQDKANRTWPAYALLGVIWSPNKSVDLDVGAKFGVNKAEVTRQFGVGVTLHY